MIPTLTTDRLILRAHGDADIAASRALWSEPEVVHRIGRPAPGLRDARERVMRYLGHWHLEGFGYWAACDRSDGSYLGEVGLSRFLREMTPPLGNAPEAGWVMSTATHGRGLGGEAVAAMLQWADRHIDSDHSVCILDPEHLASRNLALRAGYSDLRDATYNNEKIRVMRRMRPAGGV
ncbi:Protein N-acetyltransferase, RimJ/RimL family [Monaibacterium marinum]|uniref:Protein N-acetyltransferase, RimJ/RimL family n=1 Tax=Pontivivens marinum TaxID=1690039 RepID=A0A2C9CPS3_9RHOB|nr:GNAT family N-acetyltransferase [Monaibacterium marinum]SOH92359.1 Protein N-acetyltransferase, RimJ/RimL family [Monaibacterium marinum]